MKKFVLLIAGELRCIHKTIKKIYKYIIDHYDADIIILCQKQFEDDEERLKLFDRRVKFMKLYEKPNPVEYFGLDSNIDFNIINGINDNIAWRHPSNLQIFINMNEMSKIITNYDYDYFLFFRTDINILFPFPDKELFENISDSVYAFDANYSRFWGGQGIANFIHKKYIYSFLTSCYDYIKNPDIDKYLINNTVDIYQIIPEYYNEITNFDETKINKIRENKIGINQEQFFILAIQSKNIKISKIKNINYYYTAELETDHTTWGKIKKHSKYNVICKYEEQVNEAFENMLLWNKMLTWKIKNNEIILS